MDIKPHNYTSSVHYDRRLYRHDIAGSVAHVRMLACQGIVTTADAEVIVGGLEEICQEIEQGTFPWRVELEDIHMNVERRLFDKIGDIAGRLHTARSRNDQVALDMRLFVKEAIKDVLDCIHRFCAVLVEQADANIATVLPGYTHLQRAQPVLFAHHMLAYFEMLDRDSERFEQAYNRADVMPLGSGALAGSPYSIDREFVARELGFKAVTANSMDAVSDRDFLFDFHSAAAICAVHLSRLAEELVIWSSEEFGFVTLSDEYTTGSSMMPQKHNPDYAELARGRTGRVFGQLLAVLTMLKGLPLTYNRDLQEDKEGLFSTVDILKSTLEVSTGMVSTMQVNSDRMREATEAGHILATDVADYMVAKGIPFREAYSIVAKLVSQATAAGKKLNQLSLEDYKRFSPVFNDDVLLIDIDSSIASRDVLGGTATSRVVQAIKIAKARLEAHDGG